MKRNDDARGAIVQRDKETFAVAPRIPCGVVTPQQLRKIADVAEKYNCAALKITSAARIALVGLQEQDIDHVMAELQMTPGAAIGLCVRSIKACPGTTFCKRGQQDSLGVGMKLDELYHGMELPGKMKIGVSGCPNQCAETGFKDLGLVGTPKGWRVYVGGAGGGSPRISELVTEGLSDDDAMDFAAKIIDYFKANAKKHERMGKLIDRLGLDALKQAVGITDCCCGCGEA
ncbi:MAG: NAD(P)/FAD-dependent oxidoreductase [Phycisphaerae bacterium]|nr:NAD(P)/FAD-dependent oxidoreductase [Phycisphaerae bacterium]